MSKILAVNLENLLECRGVESERVEFKASWSPRTTGPQALRTICAFANDYHNLNGGYIVIGVEEQDGRAVLPPRGLSDAEVEAAQRWIRGQCNRLDPVYHPVLSPEIVAGSPVLVVWAPASDTKPHRAPSPGSASRRFWVRLGSETVDAEQRGDMLAELLRQTARVPWDDRRAQDARVEDLSETKVREHLRDIRSGLLDEPNRETVFRSLRLTSKANGHEIPRNVGLLFFSRMPDDWFRGARIDVVQFAADASGDVIEERTFRGPLADQLHSCLQYLEGLSVTHVMKQPREVRARRWVSYPMRAIREAIVNAAYHRSYDADNPDPTCVYFYPSRVEITSYPGPVPGIEREHLVRGAELPQIRARNRRIGEFLTDLRLTEERLTGLRKIFLAMERNGSPPPRFDFDEQRTYFRVTLPVHPEFGALSALRDAAHLRALGEDGEALIRVESAWKSNPSSAVLAAETIRLHARSGEIAWAASVLDTFRSQGASSDDGRVANALAEAFLDCGKSEEASRLLGQDDPPRSGREALDAAILARRAGDSRLAHRYFERAGEAMEFDPRALLEFAQTKFALAREAESEGAGDSRERLLAESRSLLEEVIRLAASPMRHSCAWREVARILVWGGAPAEDIEDAYRKAVALWPEERGLAAEMQRSLGGKRPAASEADPGQQAPLRRAAHGLRMDLGDRTGDPVPPRSNPDGK